MREPTLGSVPTQESSTSLRYSPVALAAANCVLVACGGGTPVEELVKPQAEDDALVKALSVNLGSLPAAPAGLFVARNNSVGGGMQLTNNLGGGEVVGNRITGALQCSGNTAASWEGDCAPGASAGGGGVTMPPLTGNITCLGFTVGAVQVDSMTVPAGAGCTLVGTRLTGNLEVGAGSRLSADSVQVTGGLASDGATSVTVSGTSSFGGSLQVQRGLAANLLGLAATGDLQIETMQGPVVATNNRISGNAQVMANRGGVTLSTNRFGGVMQCKDNLPAPTGSGNVATLKEDQCRPL